MKRSDIKPEIQNRITDVSPEEFEHLTKILIEEIEQTCEIELTPFHGDGGIDIRGSIGQDFYRARFGVQVKQFSKNVGSPSMRNFVGALRSHDYQFGCFVTTSEFSSGAIRVAEGELSHPITLINGEKLIEIMIDQEIGVSHYSDVFEIDEDFWNLFGTSTGDNLVKSDAVPQADSFDTIELVMQAINEGCRYKHEILDHMQDWTENDWTPRQADYYPQAAWALGYVHKDKEGEYEGRTMRQWGLTRDGEEYLTYIHGEDDLEAEENLLEHIRQSDIIQSVLDYLRQNDPISHDELGEVIEKESELNATTAERRSGTVGNWLDMLPEVRQSRDGQSYKYEYLEKNLSDF